MKILYGVQGTGHGHISRARVVVPKLREWAEVDVLISGYNFHLDLDGPVQYQARGVSLTYDRRGSIDFLETAFQLKPMAFLKDLQELPVEEYDFVVNDFEPVTAWAAQSAGIPCVAISHQASFLSDKTPRPAKRSLLSEGVLKHFAPCTAAIGSHYRRYDDFIEPPIIRDHIKNLTPSAGGHVTVYLPAFDHQSLCSLFNQLREVEWHIFSPECKEHYQKNNVQVFPVGKESFLESFEDCLGLICSTGFEATSEAMYLGKQLLTIPIRNQYEQLCNAAAIEELGGEVVYTMDADFLNRVRSWLINGKVLHLPEVSDGSALAQRIIREGMAERTAAIA